METDINKDFKPFVYKNYLVGKCCIKLCDDGLDMPIYIYEDKGYGKRVPKTFYNVEKVKEYIDALEEATNAVCA